jgi:Spy/CpxP family protein refolding chaperone
MAPPRIDEPKGNSMQHRTHPRLPSLLAVIALVALAGSAAARPPSDGPFAGRHGEDHHERFLEKHAERLGVDEETRQAIEARFESSREQAEPIRDALHASHRALREMLREEEPDRSAIMSLAEATGELEIELRKLRLATLLEVRAMLTEEQRDEMVAIHEERMQSDLQPMMEACADDVDALCPDVEDPRSLMHCMRENRETLSEDCRDSLGKGHPRRSHGGSACPGAQAGNWPEG